MFDQKLRDFLLFDFRKCAPRDHLNDFDVKEVSCLKVTENNRMSG